MSGSRRKKPVPVTSLLDGDLPHAGAIFSHLELLQVLQNQLSRHLDPELAKHCHIANYRNGILTLSTESANWATRIRYSVPEILSSMDKNPLPVTVKSIRVVVVPEHSSPFPGNTERKPFLSQESARLMTQMADSINDAELSASIRRLCRHSSLKS
ncbi:MAG: DUF721 domain-containing protein [Gammaproteobacteria bacterium]|nr:DUF721 domain-containing protein [Gammaproteobacteria bacterium]